MDILTTVAAWLALALAVPSAAVAALQVQHYIRFRRPVFTVQEAELPLQRTSYGLTMVGPGKIALNARGARYPVTLTRCGCMLYTSGRMGGSGGAWFAQDLVTLQPEVWTGLPVEHFGIGIPGELPSHLYGEVYLLNPRDTFVVPLKLKLSGGGSKYSLDEFAELTRWAGRTWDRGRRGFPGMLRAFQARLRRAHR